MLVPILRDQHQKHKCAAKINLQRAVTVNQVPTRRTRRDRRNPAIHIEPAMPMNGEERCEIARGVLELLQYHPRQQVRQRVWTL